MADVATARDNQILHGALRPVPESLERGQGQSLDAAIYGATRGRPECLFEPHERPYAS
jgi:hypothetical protein